MGAQILGAKSGPKKTKVLGGGVVSGEGVLFVALGVGFVGTQLRELGEVVFGFAGMGVLCVVFCVDTLHAQHVFLGVGLLGGLVGFWVCGIFSGVGVILVGYWHYVDVVWLYLVKSYYYGVVF